MNTKIEGLDGKFFYSNPIHETRQNEKVSFLKYLKNAIDKVDMADKEANKLAKDLILGKDVRLCDVMISFEKAEIYLKFMVAIRNKALEAYKELMRIQV